MQQRTSFAHHIADAGKLVRRISLTYNNGRGRDGNNRDGGNTTTKEKDEEGSTVIHRLEQKLSTLHRYHVETTSVMIAENEELQNTVKHMQKNKGGGGGGHTATNKLVTEKLMVLQKEMVGAKTRHQAVVDKKRTLESKYTRLKQEHTTVQQEAKAAATVQAEQDAAMVVLKRRVAELAQTTVQQQQTHRKDSSVAEETMQALKVALAKKNQECLEWEKQTKVLEHQRQTTSGEQEENMQALQGALAEKNKECLEWEKISDRAGVKFIDEIETYKQHLHDLQATSQAQDEQVVLELNKRDALLVEKEQAHSALEGVMQALVVKTHQLEATVAQQHAELCAGQERKEEDNGVRLKQALENMASAHEAERKRSQVRMEKESEGALSAIHALSADVKRITKENEEYQEAVKVVQMEVQHCREENNKYRAGLKAGAVEKDTLQEETRVLKRRLSGVEAELVAQQEQHARELESWAAMAGNTSARETDAATAAMDTEKEIAMLTQALKEATESNSKHSRDAQETTRRQEERATAARKEREGRDEELVKCRQALEEVERKNVAMAMDSNENIERLKALHQHEMKGKQVDNAAAARVVCVLLWVVFVLGCVVCFGCVVRFCLCFLPSLFVLPLFLLFVFVFLPCFVLVTFSFFSELMNASKSALKDVQQLYDTAREQVQQLRQHRQQQQDNNSRSGIGVVDGGVDGVGGGVVDGVVDAGGVDVGVGGVKSASAVKAKAELLREKHLIGKAKLTGT